jgi:hypothetical protein
MVWDRYGYLGFKDYSVIRAYLGCFVSFWDSLGRPGEVAVKSVELLTSLSAKKASRVKEPGFKWHSEGEVQIYGVRRK